MPYKLPKLEVPGSRSGTTELALSSIEKLEVITEGIIDGIDKRVETLRLKQEQVRNLGLQVTAPLKEVEGVSPPASPLLASVSSGLPLPPLTSLPPTAGQTGGDTTITSGAADEEQPLPGVLVKDVRVKIDPAVAAAAAEAAAKAEGSNGDAVKKDDNAPTASPASPPSTTAAAELATTTAATAEEDSKKEDGAKEEEKEKKKVEGVDFERKILVEIRFPRDHQVIEQLRYLDELCTEYLEEMQNISDLFALRGAMFNSGSQAKQMMQAIDGALDELSTHLIDFRDMHKDYLRGRCDMEKTIIKHPTSEYVFRRRLLHSIETWDLLDDAYRGLIIDCMHMKLIFTRDLPLIEEVLQMEGDIGAMAGGGESGMEMMFM